MIFFIFGFLYILIGTSVFVFVSYALRSLNDPFEGPEPTLCALFWPIGLPLMGFGSLAIYMCKRIDKYIKNREIDIKNREVARVLKQTDPIILCSECRKKIEKGPYK